MRLRARDHSTSSTLIGGKGGAGPSSLQPMLEGPTEYVNAKMDAKCAWIHACYQMDHVSLWSLGIYSKTAS